MNLFGKLCELFNAYPGEIKNVIVFGKLIGLD